VGSKGTARKPPRRLCCPPSRYGGSLTDLAAYSITSLGTLGGNQSFALDVNNTRQVTGNARTTNQTLPLLAFLWDNQMLTNLAVYRPVCWHEDCVAI
jgi:uncharacterized membrane protein